MSSSVAEAALETGAPARAPARDEFDSLIYHITHDLRAPLRALSILPEWIAEDIQQSGGTVSQSVGESLRMMQVQSQRMDAMLLDLRTLSRIGRNSDTPSLLLLATVLEEARKQADLPERYQIETDLVGVVARGPLNDFTTLFAALIGNAAKHHDREFGRIHVAASATPTGVAIAVEDDGPGIRPEFREKVFEMMTTLRPRDEVEGSGLGLAICRKIIQQAGGEICAKDPEILTGTRIEIALPA